MFLCEHTKKIERRSWQDLRSEVLGTSVLQMIRLYQKLFSEKQLHIFFHTVNSCNTKNVNQNFGYIWRKESWKGWPQVDIFYPEGKESQENDHGFLLIPCNVVDDRKFIDILKAKYFLKFHGDHCKRVGIVALACVQNTWNTVDISKVQFVVAIFCTAGSEDHSVFRESLGKIGVVASGFCTAIAACHDYEFTDGTGFYSGDDLVSQGDYLIMGKTSDDFTVFDLCGSCTAFCMADDLGEIFFAVRPRCDVGAAWIAGSTCGVDPVFVTVLWRNDAVGGHEDGAVEAFELFLLFPPGVSVVACKVWTFFECRIVMGRKHLGVGVNVNAGSLGLLKKHFQVVKIVAGNQDSGVFAGANVDFCDFRISKSFGVGLVKKCHAANAEFSGLQSESSQLLCGETVVQSFCESALDKSIQRRVFVKKGVCMAGVGAETLEAVGDQLTEASDVLILCGKNTGDIFHGVIINGAFRVPECGSWKAVSVRELCKKLLFGREGFADLCNDGIFVEICVCDGGKKVLDHHVVDIGRDFPVFGPKCGGDGGKSFCDINEKILHCGYVRFFAADTGDGATGTSGGFLTLITKHFWFHNVYLLW